MYVKRVFAPSVREALAAVRAQLGDDALVLSTELVPAPGWRGWIGGRIVRLTAAAERGIELDTLPLADRAGDDAIPAALVSADRQLVSAGRPGGRPDVRAGVRARLEASGVAATLAAAVVDRMSEADCRGGSDDALRRALGAELTACSAVDEEHARFEVFVGPAGVGKTTTIAKIAAQNCAARRAPLGLVAADAFRPGAIEQLRSYAAVMGLPLRLARSTDELEDALATTRPATLVDTAGRSPSDDSIAALFDVLRRKRGVRTHLVLPADTSAATARRVLDRYQPLHPSRVVITKLDECESMMPLFDAVRERGLPVSYLAAGQRVPEDLWRATPAHLAAALLRESALEEQTCH
ncbi:MAG: hypothetical protein IT184_17385 [Acidobacteria bacterium]|nr:hypothetical protein [Acidobacteriota bacterium]